jgi:uncharacterized protein
MHLAYCLSAYLICLCLLGCDKVSQATGATWHQKVGWKAEDYFTDPKVIALCRAIEANDLSEMDRLIAAGAEVNAKGKDGMTLLLWAFPDNKLDRFKKLLEHGADPNVITKSDFNTHGGFHPGGGDSVTHMACRTEFPGYFEAVFDHGADPNLIRNWTVKSQTPLFSVITGAGPNKKAHVQTLIDKGADLNQTDSGGGTATMTAVGWGGQYDIALMLLEAGADPKIYQSNEVQKLSHVVVRQESLHLKNATVQQQADFSKLVNWLDNHGESIDQARADLKRWASWNTDNGEFRRNLDAEIAERKARESQQKQIPTDHLH